MNSQTDLTALPLSEAADLIQRRQISPVELTRAYLDRIAQHDSALNCFITLTADLALAQAAQAESEIAAGTYRGPLHGIPLALKDLFETIGVRTTGGSVILKDHVPTEDSEVVRRLDAAGAVLLGKLNMHEWALGVTNINPHFGPCRNPWDSERIPGGSSGGSGAALAARLCAGAMGSDTRGSIRIPSALCGVVGLKPTYGRVSVRGVLPLSWSLDHAGPMARRVTDVALLLQAIAGYDAADAYSVAQMPDDYLTEIELGIRGWRVGVLDDDYFSHCDADVSKAFRVALQAMESLGAALESVSLPWAEDAYQRSRLMLAADAIAYHRALLESQPGNFGTEMIERLKHDGASEAVDYAEARHQQALNRRALETMFGHFDLLIAPTVPMAAARIDDEAEILRSRRTLTRFTAPFNVAGVPAISVPCGFTAGGLPGLPIGLQIIGPHWAEARVLRAAYAYEQATDWHLREAIA